MNKNKLFLLDAYALIYRAYYAFIKFPRIDQKEGILLQFLVFINTLEEVLNKENPTHIAIGFDPDGQLSDIWNMNLIKAQREATPEVIKASVPI